MASLAKNGVCIKCHWPSFLAPTLANQLFQMIAAIILIVMNRNNVLIVLYETSEDHIVLQDGQFAALANKNWD